MHLRATINGAQERPICALCRRADKNSPLQRAEQATAFDDSNAVLARVAQGEPRPSPLTFVRRPGPAR